ncbi:MAG: hypothetical protein N4A71_14975 [Carboxylicivirga sp.]|nr:hypothetical protein [Carboxylicivirga sp.]
MEKITVKPYTITKNKTFSNDDILAINKSQFEKVKKRNDKVEICFEDCTFHRLVIKNIEDIDFENISIMFVNCIIRDISIEEITTSNINIYFGNSIINGRIDNKRLTRVEINNCLLFDSIFLLNIDKVSISYTSANLRLRAWQKQYDVIGKDYKYFRENNQLYHISNSKEITYSQDDKIFNGPRFARVSLMINYSPTKDHYKTKIINPTLNSLSLEGTTGGEMEIESGIIDNWFMSGFSLEGGVNFFNIRASNIENDKKLQFDKCILDGFHFDNIDFNSYKELNFYRNKFGETSITSCSFPNNYDDFDKFYTIENIHNPDEKPDDYYNIRYNTFLQFKKAVEASGNIYESHKFQSVSKDALRKINEIGWWNRRILGLNSWSNDHGLSIAKPLVHILWVSITLYLFYLLSLGRLFNGNEIDWNLFGYYFKFLDITHWSNFLVAKSELNGFSMAIDFLNKVIVGFFIYQFIAAFRKYGKK